VGSGQVIDSWYLGDVGRHPKPPASAAIGPQQCPRYVVCDNRLDRLAVAIVAMNPPSLWTPLPWEWGSIIRSCTVCTFDPNASTMPTPFLHLEGCVWGSLIYRNEFPGVSWDVRVTSEKSLQFELQLWRGVCNIETDSNTLDNTSIRHCSNGNELLRLTGKRWSRQPLGLSSRSQHHHPEACPNPILTQKYICILMYISTTVQQVMITCVFEGNNEVPLQLSSRSQHGSAHVTPILTQSLTAHPMIGTERLRMGIKDAPAGWSRHLWLNTQQVLQFNIYFPSWHG